MYCSNCGHQLSEGARFCHACGAAVGGFASVSMPAPAPMPAAAPIPTPMPDPTTVRQQEYAGKITKCPNCGSQVDSMASSCPACGTVFSGKAANSTILDFKNQLMSIEMGSSGSGLNGVLDKIASMGKISRSEKDRQKIALIQSYPIPNTIEEMSKFMYLAVANIDVSLSKKSLFASTNPKANSAEKAVSDAWVAKMEQIFRKAERVFPNDPAFGQIREIYLSKMRELKIKTTA